MTRVQLSLLAPSGSRLVAKTRRCQRRNRGFESRLPLQVSEYVRGGVAKTARHLPAKQTSGSAILPTASRFERKLCAGVAPWEEQAHGERPTAVRGCVPAPRFSGLAQWKCRELVPLRRVFDLLDQLQIRWRDWPNGLGAGLWIQSREFDSLISPQMGGSYTGITHGLQP